MLKVDRETKNPQVCFSIITFMQNPERGGKVGCASDLELIEVPNSDRLIELTLYCAAVFK